MIVVTGATGRLGRVVVEDLLTRVPADRVAAVARDPARASDLADRGVAVRHGDYDDADGLSAAFDDADVLLFVSSPDTEPGVRRRQHLGVVRAAVQARVGRIVYTSIVNAERAPGLFADHMVTEDAIRASGLPFTILRNTFYMDVFVNPGLRAAVDAGELRAADGGEAVNTATVTDLGLGASHVLTSDVHAGQTHDMCGPLWIFPELALILSDEAGKPVGYREIPLAEAGPTAFVYELVRDRFLATSSMELENMLGRRPTGLREAVRDALQMQAQHSTQLS
jgi:NAD(P)H dehydrogenase (quinone)